ncbi:axonemal dynein light intermediate polypeptide 1 isoform X2 [Vicugna pacos]|uniref:Axonemal dynein light intermediate polypeptide 1 n=1 Tax=Vicugna pacos TaxID=30538 RepID=A0ABM5ECG4_VICPA
MIPPADSLLKYDTPVLVSRNTEKRSPKARPLKVSPQQPGPSGPVPQPPKTKLPSTSCVPDPTKQAEEILNAILPPREWVEDTQLWIQQVSSNPSTRMDVVHLQEQLDLKLQQRQARETGICPVRRELYSQCFDCRIRIGKARSGEASERAEGKMRGHGEAGEREEAGGGEEAQRGDSVPKADESAAEGPTGRDYCTKEVIISIWVSASTTIPS